MTEDEVFETLDAKIQGFGYRGYHSGRSAGVSPAEFLSNRPDVIRVDIDRKKYLDTAEIKIWCQEMFGNNWLWGFKTFHFKNEQDATLFRLRWG